MEPYGYIFTLTLIFQFPIYLEPRGGSLPDILANPWKLGSKYIGSWKIRARHLVAILQSYWTWGSVNGGSNTSGCLGYNYRGYDTNYPMLYIGMLYLGDMIRLSHVIDRQTSLWMYDWRPKNNTKPEEVFAWMSRVGFFEENIRIPWWTNEDFMECHLLGGSSK